MNDHGRGGGGWRGNSQGQEMPSGTLRRRSTTFECAQHLIYCYRLPVLGAGADVTLRGTVPVSNLKYMVDK